MVVRSCQASPDPVCVVAGRRGGHPLALRERFANHITPAPPPAKRFTLNARGRGRAAAEFLVPPACPAFYDRGRESVSEGIMADQLISCDDHMDLSQLPADLWTTRLPATLRDRAPHIEERDGQAVWVCDGKVWGRWDGKPPATGSSRPVKALYNAFDRAAMYDQSARRPAIPELRLADMDRDGV